MLSDLSQAQKVLKSSVKPEEYTPCPLSSDHVTEAGGQREGWEGRPVCERQRAGARRCGELLPTQ